MLTIKKDTIVVQAFNVSLVTLRRVRFAASGYEPPVQVMQQLPKRSSQ